jgi:hypothetical protein
LKDAFKSKSGSSLEMLRGSLSLLEKSDFDLKKQRDKIDKKITKPSKGIKSIKKLPNQKYRVISGLRREMII